MLRAVIDERFARALHVEALRRGELHAESDPAVLFQASTIGALLEGAYEGDVSFAELAEHGDLGLGTLNALDGEMIALDARFFRADVDGRLNEIDPDELTPFAVVVPFESRIVHSIDRAGVTQAELLAALDGIAEAYDGACALRIEADRFATICARSVPRQSPPYRPLAEVIADQHVFELHDVEGTIVGFRFPDHSEGIELGGYHLHFVTADRSRGGHVLDFTADRASAHIDPASDLRVELPPGIELEDHHLDAAGNEALERIERG